MITNVIKHSYKYAGVLSGYSGFLPPLKNMHVRLIGDAKMSLGVSVSAQPLGSTRQCISSASPKQMVMVASGRASVVKHVPRQ